MASHVLLSIGIHTFWLPNDAGVAGLMKALSKAVEVSEEGFGRTRRLVPSDREYSGRVRVEYTDLKPVIPKPEPPPVHARIGRESSGKQRRLLLEHKP